MRKTARPQNLSPIVGPVVSKELVALLQRTRQIGLALFFFAIIVFSSNRGSNVGGDNRGVTDLAWWLSQSESANLRSSLLF